MDEENKENTQQSSDGEEKLDSAALVELNQSKQDEVLAKLVKETDLDKVKDLTHLFNTYLAKRNAIRMTALNDVQDALVRQMLERLQKYPDNFANKDIADWMKTVQAALAASSEKVEQLDDIPTITYQQNTQVNVNIVDSLSRESRARVMSAVEEFLKQAQNTPGDDVCLEGGDQLEEVQEETPGADDETED